MPNHYWGKADRDKETRQWHPLPYHSLDVAAVGKRILQAHPPLLRHLVRLTGMEQADFERWAVLLLALHDLGKFSVTFQGLRPDLLQELQGGRSTSKSYATRHDTLGYLLWHKLIQAEIQASWSLPLQTGRRREPRKDAINIWMAAMTGHHGTPPETGGASSLDKPFESCDQAAALAFVTDASRLLLADNPTFPKVDLDKIRYASWWLAGFAVLCDWIGSNRKHFPYQTTAMPLDDYWCHTCQQADKAITDTGLLPKAIAPSLCLEQLISGGQPPQATPLQALAAELELAAGPQLFILEDVTGAGKTEAALLLAQRLMAAGQAHGLYLGLPTMATANAMYQRVGTGYRGLYENDSSRQPTLVLAHSQAALSEPFRQSIIENQADANYGDQPGAAAHCTEWLADGRKKALLADVGVGTIDQALLAVLSSRHQSLRLLGLLGKVLIVDEVHACDAYVLELLCELLQAHAASGGSAILLSATLPWQQRQQLAAAFSKGLQRPEPQCQQGAYPLLTHVATDTLQKIPLDTRPSVKRTVQVACLEAVHAVEEKIEEAVAEGQCVCWIRNTVADACESYEHLCAQHPDWQITLFHARFAMGDRLDIENRILKTFGRDSGHADRCGQVLIATQVVEQSLDLDFDHLISDLAPIDRLVQRAGRLRRHCRDGQGNPLPRGDDQRGPVTFTLHTPAWQGEPDAKWYSNTFPGAARVYENHAQLWLGLKLLRQAGGFKIPDNVRALIEGVYGPQAEVPAGLQAQADRAQGNDNAERSLGKLNTLKMDGGYSDTFTNRWWGDTLTPTRLGEPTTTVWLARWQDDRLVPLRDDGEFAWQQSSLSLRTSQIEQTAPLEHIPQTSIDACRESLPQKGKWGVLLPLIEIDSTTWRGSLVDADGKTITFEYLKNTGLQVKKTNRA